VAFSYRKGKRALDGASLSVKENRIEGILGPNGSGKTTLLKTMAGLFVPDSGTVFMDGQPIAREELKGQVSFLPDSMPLPRWMKVEDAFSFWSDMYPGFDAERAASLQKSLGLDPKEKAHALSKGMAERLSLALAFSRKAKAYLLDEPLGGIDPAEKQKIISSILSVDLAGSSILLSTHLLKDVETLFDSVHILHNGKIALEGDCDALRGAKGMSLEEIYLEAVGYAQ
jgi:ABC-2 type transport system ATP-binding protein